MASKGSLIPASGVESSLRTIRSIDDLRRLLSYPAWGFVTQLLNRTRAYDSALTGAELLIEVIEKYETELDQKEHDCFLQSAYRLKLQMLDKLDLWDEYLEYWNQLRVSTEYELRYSRSDSEALYLPDSKDVSNEDLKRADLVRRVDQDSIYVHWLYGLAQRYNVIQRKLKRRNSGASRKSDLHHSQFDLSEKEVKRRLVEFERIVSNAWSAK